MHTAYSYVRFSSKPQELGDSLRRQVKLARDYAAKHDLHLDERSYQDLGISAFKGKNAAEGALAAFLKAVDEKLIPTGSYLLVESLDRVSRASVMDALHVFQSIIKRGITLVTLQDEQVYSRSTIDENWTKLIMALAVMARANEESATKSKRVKSAWAGKRERGEILTAMGPAWLQLNEQRTKWLPVPEKVKIVQYVFKLAASGLGAPTIANKLNDEQIDTMGSGKNKAEYWEPGVVMALLKNRSVIGTFTPKKADADVIEGYYPVIIKPEVFHLVQEHIARRRGTGGRKGTNVANLFVGALRCTCGSRVRYVSATKPNLYVRCVRAYSNVGCDAPTVPYTAVEDKIMFWLCMFEGVDFALNGQVLDDPAIALRGELEERRKAYANLLALVEAGKSYAGGMTKVLERMGALELEITNLEKAIRTVVVPTPASSAVQETVELYKRHQELKAKGGGPELEELRLKLQSTMKRLITKMVLLQETHHEATQDVFYREVVLYGPLVEMLRGNEYWEIWDKTDDGGLIQDYPLPKQGFHGSPKRRMRAVKQTQKSPGS